MNKLISNTTLWLKIFTVAAYRLYNEKYTYSASALAFTAILAIVPLISVIVPIVALFPIFSRFVELTQNYIFMNFIPASNDVIQSYLLSFVNQASQLSTTGIGFLFFTVFTLIVTVEHTLNNIWQAPPRDINSSIFLLYWLILILAPIFIGLSVFISTYVFSLALFTGPYSALSVIPFLTFLPLLINTIIFSLIYKIVPNCYISWSDGLLGGFITACLFEITKRCFAFYLQQFHSYQIIYGAFAIIPIFLLWIYISWLIVLYGALVLNTKYQYSLSQKS